MRLVRAAVAAIILVGVSGMIHADELPYRAGETIHYNIQKMGIKFGSATLTLQGPRTIMGKETVLIVFTSKAPNFYDQERIYLDPVTFRPLLVARDVHYLGKKERIGEEYLPNEIKITKRVGNETTRESLPVKGEIDNIYGFLYRYRASGSFKIGDEVNVRLPTKEITLKITKQVSIDVAKTKYDAYYMESGEYKVWFDAGPGKIPLRISGAVGFGDTAMIMKEYKR